MGRRIFLNCLAGILLGIAWLPKMVSASNSTILKQEEVFVENVGQLTDSDGKEIPEILFFLRSPGMSVYFRAGSVSYVLDQSVASHDMLASSDFVFPKVNHVRIDVEYVGCAKSAPEPESETWYVQHYYRTRTLARITGRTFQRIVYRNIYPQIDLVWYFNGSGLKYDFVLHPGGDPEAIIMQYHGIEKCTSDQNGSLSLNTSLGSLIENPVYAYQDDDEDGARRIEASYNVIGNSVGFAIGEFDRRHTLIIDPALQWSTFYGSSGLENAKGVAVDDSGNVYMVGTTDGSAFPVSVGAFQGKLSGGYDSYVVKFSLAGARLWSTFVGGTADDAAYDIAIDASGNVCVVGSTYSINYPVSNMTYQSTNSGKVDAFVFRMSSGGSLLWSTYLGGTYDDEARGIATNSAGSIFVGGFTSSSNFPASSAYQQNYAGGRDGFVTAFSGTGAMLWSTFLGGSSDDRIHGVDCGNGIYVSGETNSTNFPTSLGAYRTFNAGSSDAFISQFTETGALSWSTYYGGPSADASYALTTDGNGDVYITGETFGDGLPVTDGTFQSAFAGMRDAYVAKFLSNGTYSWASYYGGSYIDHAFGITADGNDNVVFVGYTRSGDLPVTTGAFQTVHGGGFSMYDAFLVGMNSDGQRLWATFFGGDHDEGARAVVTDGSNNLIFVGECISSNLPTSNAFQNAFAGGAWDGFAAKFSAILPLGIVRSSHVATFNVFPDPNNGVANLSISSEIPATWRITMTNVLGQRVMEFIEDGPRNQLRRQLDMSAVPSGIYLLRIQTERDTWIRRIVKQ